MRRFITLIDTLSTAAMVAASGVALTLVAAMLYEVVARYVFDSPTMWAFDISYMLNGCIFLLGAAYALKKNAHVRIDFIYQRFPSRWQKLIDRTMFLFVLFPLFSLLAWIAGEKAWRAWLIGEVEPVSPWAPLMWPFYSVIAVGLALFTLQLLAEGLRRFDRLSSERADA